MNSRVVLNITDQEGCKIENPEEGQFGFDLNNNQVYRYFNNKWERITVDLKDQGIILGNLYDMNKQIIAQLSDLTDEEIQEKRKVIEDYVSAQKAEYYMMLCHDIKYFTLLHPSLETNSEKVSFEVIECLGYDVADSIKSIELTEDKSAIEIWFTQDDQLYVMYLFNYDNGVIHID